MARISGGSVLTRLVSLASRPHCHIPIRVDEGGSIVYIEDGKELRLVESAELMGLMPSNIQQWEIWDPWIKKTTPVDLE